MSLRNTSGLQQRFYLDAQAASWKKYVFDSLKDTKKPMLRLRFAKMEHLFLFRCKFDEIDTIDLFSSDFL